MKEKKFIDKSNRTEYDFLKSNRLLNRFRNEREYGIL